MTGTPALLGDPASPVAKRMARLVAIISNRSC